jgi:hypothetical protein
MLNHETAHVPHTQPEITPVDVELVREALHSPICTRRTIHGIHLETGLPPENVEEILETTGVARRTSHTTAQEGNPIYVAAERRKTAAERIADLRGLFGKVMPMH